MDNFNENQPRTDDTAAENPTVETAPNPEQSNPESWSYGEPVNTAESSASGQSGADPWNYGGAANTEASHASHAVMQEKRPENVFAGIIGAFLLSLLGGALYFIIYRFGYIAGICGLVTVILADWGYRKFSGAQYSIKGVVIAVIVSIIAIFLGEYFSLSYEIYDVFSADYYITFMDAVELTPEFLSDPEILPAVIKDLLIAYALGAVASFGKIKQAIDANK